MIVPKHSHLTDQNLRFTPSPSCWDHPQAHRRLNLGYYVMLGHLKHTAGEMMKYACSSSVLPWQRIRMTGKDNWTMNLIWDFYKFHLKNVLEMSDTHFLLKGKQKQIYLFFLTLCSISVLTNKSLNEHSVKLKFMIKWVFSVRKK